MSTLRDPSHPTSKQAECECVSWVGPSQAPLPEANQNGGGKGTKSEVAPPAAPAHVLQ